MAIQLNAELEALVLKEVAEGPYGTADEFLEKAVRMLHEQELWFREQRDEIAARIQEGYASAERGDLLDPDEARARVRARKGLQQDRHEK